MKENKIGYRIYSFTNLIKVDFELNGANEFE